ncbi:methionyl-tRNA synthetase [Nematocida minor]|uniref:methionyl-tRNA synthetase n=1 Tax=Nematocida minor TaxID=1912983 RepID=UPI0022211E3F|nr:methionyl-tRNA synthetase [Nematocida minor]KAI5189702.1 methionyl-tRNA synthetase [Nematocida minor]
MTGTKKERRLITAALPYVNNLPHLGNVVGALLSADVFARYSRMRGIETVYVCGTDEYGTASEVSADKAGKTPAELCKENSQKHKEVYNWFQIECDSFGRTSCERHKEITQQLFLEMWNNGNFSEKTELRFFCEKCNMFLADRYVNGTCALCHSNQARGDQCDSCGSILASDEIINPFCSTCSEPPVKKETKHLFYNLDTFQDKIHELMDKNAGAWTPAAKQIALEWKSKELQPRCITRDLKHKWGVPVPLEEYEGKVLYVWFDAPIGYITFTDEIGKIDWWKDSSVDLYQFMGKDNVFFHSVFFPGLLLGCNSIMKYPKLISSTHYLMYEGGKFSKSQNVGIFGHNLLNDAIGPAGIWRFHLMRNRPETGDTNFSWVEFHESLNSILINTIGNFCNRVLSYIDKKLSRKLLKTTLPQEIKETLNEALQKYIVCMEATEIRQAIQCIIAVANIGNGYIQKGFADKLAPSELGSVMSQSVNILHLMGQMLYPITPEEATKLKNMLGVEGEMKLQESFAEEIEEGRVIGQPALLFKPLTNDQISQVEKFCIHKCPFVKK